MELLKWWRHLAIVERIGKVVDWRRNHVVGDDVGFRGSELERCIDEGHK